MAVATWGTGSRTVLVIPGGPGNDVPGGIPLWLARRITAPLVRRGWTACYVTRRQGMPPGWSIRDMAHDYADLLHAGRMPGTSTGVGGTGTGVGGAGTGVGGAVDAVIGISYGGLVALALAAEHPEVTRRVVVVGAAGRFSAHADRQGLALADAESRGRRWAAGAVVARTLLPRRRWLRPLVTPVAALLARRHEHPWYRSDVLVEAHAQAAYDATGDLPRITARVLLACGDRDVDLTAADVRATVRAIPDCELRLYRGRGHLRSVADRRVGRDTLTFLADLGDADGPGDGDGKGYGDADGDRDSDAQRSDGR